jgi:glycosyltransferase involved in cell wall biosynthesis
MHLTVNQPPRSEGSPDPASSRRRVLISGGLAAGGPQTHVPLLCAVLRAAGAEVTIAAASTNWDACALEQLRAQGVRVIVSPFGFGPLQVLGKLWAFLAWPFLLRRDFDVLCCIGEGRMHFWTARFVRAGGFKVYHEIVQCPAPGSDVARLLPHMDGVVANSTKIAQEMRAFSPGVPARTIPFFTAAGPVPAPGPRAPRREGELLRIAYLGRLAPHKRPLELIDCFAACRLRAPLAPARLEIYGGDYDGEADRLRARIAELGLEKSVCLRGAYAPADLDRIFAETDLVVLPSRYEGLPLVLVEAMQRGVPVAATSAGGTAELGEANPDVMISPGVDWSGFENAMLAMAGRIRAGQVDGARLHAWTEARYGFQPVAAAWREALLHPQSFFGAPALQETRS